MRLSSRQKRAVQLRPWRFEVLNGNADKNIMPKGIPKSGKREVKPHAGQFKSGDPRSNTNGQRNAVAVAFNREIRSIISEVGNEEVKLHGQTLSRIEGAVRGMYQAATKGNVQAFNALVERVEGKVVQALEHSGKDGESVQHKVIVEYVRNPPADT